MRYHFFLTLGLLFSVSSWSADQNLSSLIAEALGESSIGNNNSGSEIRFLLKPTRSAVLATKIEGSISKLSLVPGSRFKKGDVLVKIDCSLQEAEHDFNQAQKEIAQYEYKTNKILSKSRSVGKLELYRSEQEFKKADARVSSSQALLNQCVIKAPYSGQVAKVYNKQYQYVQVGQELIEIFDDAVFEMKMLVPSSWLGRLKKGDTFEAKLDETNETFKAEVKRISPKIDSVSKTVPLTAVLVNKPKLKLYGMSGVAYIQPTQDLAEKE